MADDPLAKVETAEAWSEFCDELKKAGDVLLREDLDTSVFDRGEGLRYLGRLLRAGLYTFGENTGPKHPVFRTMPDLVKMGLDNPDNYYVGASVKPNLTYRIKGKRGTIHYLSFAAQDQNFAKRDQLAGGAGHLEDAQLQLEDDGSFEIIASQREHAGNWLAMSETTSQILVRQTFLDRATEQPVELEITCLDADKPAPAPLAPERVPGQLMGAAMYTIGASQWFADWVVAFHDKGAINTFHRPEKENHRLLGGDPNIINLLGYWRLTDDEALIIETTPPDCDYWNLQLGNIWAESLDFHFRRVHLNNRDAELASDGSLRVVISHEDPGTEPNWLDTAGHEHGTLCLRWVRSSDCPMPECRVVKLASLAGPES
jgi:hypothetical protein